MMLSSPLPSAVRFLVTRDRPAVSRYGLALLVFGAALGMTLSLRPWIVPSPFPFFFAATLVAACTGGMGPGLATTVLGSAANLLYFLPPVLGPDGSTNVSSLVRFGAFFLVSVLLSTLGAALRAGLSHAEATVAELERAEAERIQLLVREKAARAEAEAARTRANFLAEASTLLDASLDYPTTLASMACLAVPHIGDWCIIDTCEGEGDDGESGTGRALFRLAVAHADPALHAAARQLQRRYPPAEDDVHGVPHVVRTGQSEFVPEVSDGWLSTLARDAEHLSLLSALGCHSYMCVPIAARGRILGAITFVRGHGTRAYDATDLALAEDLAYRAAIAIDTARLYHQARAAAGGSRGPE